MKHGHDIRHLLDWTIVDSKQQIATANTDGGGRRAWRDLSRDDALCLLLPQHSVLDLAPGRARGDVRCTEVQQSAHHDQRERRPRPSAPGHPETGGNPMTRTG